MYQFRDDLHQIPELGFKEFKTHNYIINILQNLNGQIFSLKPTGIIWYLDCKKTNTIAFRADMDALAILEETSIDKISLHHGLMHACGHDGHMALALALAVYASNNVDKLTNNICVIFQPSEEICGGAKMVVESGILELLNIKCFIALHVWPKLEKGKLFTKKGSLMASSTEIDITIDGESSHIASFRYDCLEVACRYLTTIYDLKDRDYLFKCGIFNSGKARNVISNKTIIKGSLRSFLPESITKFINLLHQIADGYTNDGIRIEIKYDTIYPGVYNDFSLIDQLCSLHDINFFDDEIWQSEDFGFYNQIAPTAMLFLGLGETSFLHTSTFYFPNHYLDFALEAWIKFLFL